MYLKEKHWNFCFMLQSVVVYLTLSVYASHHCEGSGFCFCFCPLLATVLAVDTGDWTTVDWTVSVLPNISLILWLTCYLTLHSGRVPSKRPLGRIYFFLFFFGLLMNKKEKDPERRKLSNNKKCTFGPDISVHLDNRSQPTSMPCLRKTNAILMSFQSMLRSK